MVGTPVILALAETGRLLQVQDQPELQSEILSRKQKQTQNKKKEAEEEEEGKEEKKRKEVGVRRSWIFLGL